MARSKHARVEPAQFCVHIDLQRPPGRRMMGPSYGNQDNTAKQDEYKAGYSTNGSTINGGGIARGKKRMAIM